MPPEAKRTASTTAGQAPPSSVAERRTPTICSSPQPAGKPEGRTAIELLERRPVTSCRPLDEDCLVDVLHTRIDGHPPDTVLRSL
jgi:hypothetical protein